MPLKHPRPPVRKVAGKKGEVVLEVADVTGLSASLSGKESTSAKNAANGYAGLDENGKLSPSAIPDEAEIVFATGTEAELDGISLAVGEPGWTTDSLNFYIGAASGNVLVNTNVFTGATAKLSGVDGVAVLEDGIYRTSATGDTEGYYLYLSGGSNGGVSVGADNVFCSSYQTIIAGFNSIGGQKATAVGSFVAAEGDVTAAGNRSIAIVPAALGTATIVSDTQVTVPGDFTGSGSLLVLHGFTAGTANTRSAVARRVLSESYDEGGDVTTFTFASDSFLSTRTGQTCTAVMGTLNGVGATAQGYGAVALAAYANAVGPFAFARIGSTTNVAGPIVLRKYTTDVGNTFRQLGTVEWYLSTPEVDFLTTGTTNLAIPAGLRFYPTACGVEFTQVSGVSAPPTISIGTAANATKHRASAAVGFTPSAAFQWEPTAVTQNDSESSSSTLRGTRVSAGTGTTLKGHFWWRGKLREA